MTIHHPAPCDGRPTGSETALAGSIRQDDTEAPEIARLRAENERLRREVEAVNNEFGSQTPDWPDAWKRVADLKWLANDRWRENVDLKEQVHVLREDLAGFKRLFELNPSAAWAQIKTLTAALKDSKRRVAELEGGCPDGVRMVPSYIARDGSIHHSIRSAVERNESVVRTQAATNLLAAGASVWEAACAWSPLADPQFPDVLKRITKDTPLIISHWQCRDEPGYKVCRFEEDGYLIFVGGDAGSWSGPYGSKITLLDLARYAEDTLKKHPNLAATPTQEASHVEG